MILLILHISLNEKEMCVHFSQSFGQISTLCFTQHCIQNSSRNPAEDWYVTHDVETPG
uniref:Uncharacterized protein n=1 Tax=Anguilla anguilla TaxID=7936 RepID=A0A0E9STY9_ANGAN